MARHPRSRSPHLSVRTAILGLVLVFIALTASPIFAQADETSVPPPSKVIPRDELARLTSEADVKRRTKLALEMMDARLTLAEQRAAGQNYDAMFFELGIFHGLIDNTLAFLNESEKDRKKVINNFKRLEIGLRKFPPRLGVIRGEMPLRYEFYVRELLRYLRDARSKAIEPLFGDSVIPNSEPAVPTDN